MAKKETLVDKELNKRNLKVTDVKLTKDQDAEARNMAFTGAKQKPITDDPKLQALSAMTSQIVEDTWNEINGWFDVPDVDETMIWFENAGLTKDDVDLIKTAPVGTVLARNNRAFVKTADKKLERVEDYVFRLERTVLNQMQLRNEQVGELQYQVDALQNQLDELSETRPFSRIYLYIKRVIKVAWEKLT